MGGVLPNNLLLDSGSKIRAGNWMKFEIDKGEMWAIAFFWVMLIVTFAFVIPMLSHRIEWDNFCKAKFGDDYTYTEIPVNAPTTENRTWFHCTRIEHTFVAKHGEFAECADNNIYSCPDIDTGVHGLFRDLTPTLLIILGVGALVASAHWFVKPRKGKNAD